jgi:hypothetical protein
LCKAEEMMKYIPLVVLFVVCSSFLQTGKYPVAKLYAYQQKVSGGANFSSDTKGRAVMKQYVYLLLRNERTIEIENVWINGSEMAVTTETLQAPVTIEKSVKFGNEAAFETLVPATSHRVLQIVLAAETGLEKTIPSRYRQYPLLIAYKEAGKLYYLGAKNWQQLSPQVNQ